MTHSTRTAMARGWPTFLPLALPAALLAGLFAGCGDPRPTSPNEVYENGSGSLHESGLSATIHGTSVQVSFPVTRLSGSELPVGLAVHVLDLTQNAEKDLASASRAVFQTTPTATHVLEVSGLPAGLDRPKTAGYVLAWSVMLPQGELHGRKSLYAALGKLEVQLKGATDIPESGSVPFRAIVRDPDTLTPKAGAEVTAVLEPSAEGGQPTPLFSGTTDEKGELLFELALPAGVDEGSLRVDVKAGDSSAWVHANVRVVHERKLALSSDKTIYKPGQNVELRALALRGTDKAPLAGQDVTFEAVDGKGNKVFKRHATTDEFGAVAMSVPTDSNVNEGTWTFRALMEGAKIEKKLPVTRYNLPKMKVKVATTREFALPGDTISGHLDAHYVFGLPVVGASASLSLQLQDGTVLSTGGVTTDADGGATFALAVPSGTGGANIEDGGLAVTIAAEVTDTAGQKETGAATLPLASGELVVKALPEAGALVPSLENIVYLLVGDPVGRPILATLSVDGAGPLAPLTTDADGVAELRFTPPAAATSVALTITARDGAGRTHQRVVTLNARSEGVVLLRPDKAVYEAGETAVVRVVAPHGVARVYLDTYHGAAGLESRAVDLTGGAADVLVPMTPAMKGIVMFDAFALGGSGTVIRGGARALVDPKDRLDITLTPDKSEYGPGADAQVTISVKDASGAPKVAALGLTAVDEAVFALGGEPDDDIRAFFDLDTAILPSELRVLGRAPAELFSAQDPVAEERFARLLFASARDVAAPGVDYNTVREELPAVRTTIEARVRRDAVVFLKSIMPTARVLGQNGQLDQTQAKVLVEGGMKRVSDPFGQLYDAKIGDGYDWYQLTVRSAGPDEAFGTPDDVSVTGYYAWVQWADKAQIPDDGTWFTNGGCCFGGVDDAAAGAGGPPFPQVPGAEERANDADHSSGSSGTAVRVRSDFRETVYVNPTLITDSSGRATVSFPLADSITTWRLSAQGSTKDGQVGAARTGFRTFQEFFIDFDVPTTLTKGDEIELPAVVYNYLTTPATVRVTLDRDPWITILSPSEQSVTLAPSEVRSVKFTVRAEQAGAHQLTLRGTAGNVADALVREARVIPNGVVEDQSFSDKLNGAATHTVTVPSDASEGGTRVTLTLTPGFASEAVTGTEALLQEPNGCFEQTTSTAWPNTMVTDYLETTGQMTPELREKAIGLVTRGYQRLLTFESPTGGFNWWGDATPGNRILSAIMLWHLKDMEAVIETDPAVRDRTLNWLLAQQRADGAWASGDALHAGNETLGTSEVRTTAFITWALAHTGWADSAVEKAAGWIRANQPDATDLYANALVANALAKVDPAGSVTSAVFSRLDGLKVTDAGRVKWPTETPSWTGTSGDVAALETTGLVSYALIQANAYPENATGGLRYIVANKDAIGSWYNTQATMNSLRALLAAASPRGSNADGTLLVTVNGHALPPVTVTPADGDVYRELDLTGFVTTGDNAVRVELQGTGDLTYRLSRRAYRPRPATAPASPLALTVAYDHTSAQVGEVITANVTATYTGPGVRDQVIVRLGRAPGFEPRGEDLAQIVSSGRAARYEVNERDVTFYLMGVQSNTPRDLSVHFTPTLAVDAAAPASVIYAYYESTIRAEVPPVALHVTAP